MRLLLCLCAWAAALTASEMPQQTHPTAAWRAAQEEQIRAVVFLRLYRECGARRRHLPRVVFLNVSDRGGPELLKDPSRSTMAYLRTRVPMPIKGASALSQDAYYGPARDKTTGKTGVELAVREIEWQDRSHVWAYTDYFDRPISLSPVYLVQRRRSAWTVVAERTDRGLESDTCVLQGRSGRHRYRLLLAKRVFRPYTHRITERFDNSPEGGEYKVDGKEAIGTNCGVPHEELYRFEAWVDGKRWHVPSKLWRDCFQPDLTISPGKRSAKPRHPPRTYDEVWEGLDTDAGYVLAWLSKDARRLTVMMYGSDASGSYAVQWRLRADGRDSRRLFGGP